MTLDEVLNLPTGILVVLGILIVIELTLLIVGVVAWANTPEDRMPPPNKWLWLAIIAFLQILGPIVFLILRRQHARYSGAPIGGPVDGRTDVQAAGASGADTIRRSATSTADLLYGGPASGQAGDAARGGSLPHDSGSGR